MYPKKLVAISTHGKSVSHLIRSMPSASTPTPPQLSGVPIGFSTIPTIVQSVIPSDMRL